MLGIIASYCAGAWFLSFALAAPADTHLQHQIVHRHQQPKFDSHRRQVHSAPSPKLSGIPQVIANALDSSVTRDSCGSSPIGGRLLWTCRDTSPMQADGLPGLSIISSTASWSNMVLDGPQLDRNRMATTAQADTNSEVTTMYATNKQEAYYPIPQDLCGDNAAGNCADGTRFAIWSDSPPMVGKVYKDGSTSAWTWIRQSHIDAQLNAITKHPATILYRVDYIAKSSVESLPGVTTVDEDFWPVDAIPYGNAGNVVKDGIAYLYGATDAGIALARVSVDSIEDSSKYQYFQDGIWTYTRPSIDALAVNIPNASAGGQGTYYYSDAWESYVWIGQASMSVSAEFFITTSPQPEGPWSTPQHFYSAQNGNYSLSAYSLQAHPGMVAPGKNEIYLSYTKNDLVEGRNVYSTPLIHVVWE